MDRNMLRLGLRQNRSSNFELLYDTWELQSLSFGDNLSVVNSRMQPHGKIIKRHMALSIRRVRECIAAKIFTYLFIPTAENPADILSKHWAYNQVSETLREILFLADAH
jgi:hypothetical protein